MNNKKYLKKIFFISFLALLIIGNFYIIGFNSTKKTLMVIGKDGEEFGVYSNIKPLSLLNLIIPKNNEVECLFEIYFSYSSEKFGEDKGRFLGNVSIFFLGDGHKKMAEYYFKGVVIQANTKLTGIIWIEKEKYKKIDSVCYEVSESEDYRKFNDSYYKDILKIRGQEKESEK